MGSIPVGSTKIAETSYLVSAILLRRIKSKPSVTREHSRCDALTPCVANSVGSNICRQSNPTVSTRRIAPKLRGGFPYGVIIFSAKLKFSVFDCKFYFSIFAIISSATFASIYGVKIGHIYSAFFPSDDPININTSLGIEQSSCL